MLVKLWHHRDTGNLKYIEGSWSMEVYPQCPRKSQRLSVLTHYPAERSKLSFAFGAVQFSLLLVWNLSHPSKRFNKKCFLAWRKWHRQFRVFGTVWCFRGLTLVASKGRPHKLSQSRISPLGILFRDVWQNIGCRGNNPPTREKRHK